MATSTTSAEPLLSVERLSVDFQVAGDWMPAVKKVSFSVGRGEVVALVGESGSGKSVTSMSVLGLLSSNARCRGSIRLEGREVLGLASAELREIRGKRVAMVFQEPMTALNPVHTIGEQIDEAIRCHDNVSSAEARRQTLQLLSRVGIPEPERRVDSYPHQLSGGQRQRAVIAMAISGSPEVIIADEPTTALDVTVQAEILELLRRLQQDLGAAVLLITHDMGVVADLADRVVVMKEGEAIESASATQLFARPQHEYTKKLLAAVPRPGTTPRNDHPSVMSSVGQNLALRVQSLEVTYRGRPGRPPFTAVRSVSLSVARGKVLGLVGESGSGKSTIGRAVLGLVRASAGTIEVCGTVVTGLKGRQLRALRATYSMIFQDPGSSLNPRLRIGDSIAAPMLINRFADRKGIRRRVSELLEQVELPAGWADRFPHELSGGQRQRVAIARALALDPALLVADEPTSALDVSIQATVLRLLQDLQGQLGFSCLFISHDLGVVETLADDVAVVHNGGIVETGPAGQVLNAPQAEYTRRLIAAAPVPDPAEQCARRRIWRETVTA